VSAPSGNQALNEQRMRRIYDEYAAARKKNNEGDVRYETLASSIQKMLPDLSKKHQGKQIDFEVVLKDGRVGLKPKAT
jgi:CRISPR/Cas system CSM-associated protein Csm2 small subunit